MSDQQAFPEDPREYLDPENTEQPSAHGTGLLTTPGAEGCAFFNSRPGLSRPDLQAHFVVAIVDDHMRRMHLADGWSLHVCVLRPESRGEILLKSADPLAPPAIHPNYLAEETDRRVLVVCHQVVVLCMRYIIEHLSEAEILAIDKAGDIANCAITQYRLDRSGKGDGEMAGDLAKKPAGRWR